MSSPWDANNRLLHLGVLDSGSYVNRRSRRAKQEGKVRETSFVWANVGHSPALHPPKTHLAHVWDRTRYIAYFFDMFGADLHLDMTYVGTPTFVLPVPVPVHLQVFSSPWHLHLAPFDLCYVFFCMEAILVLRRYRS